MAATTTALHVMFLAFSAVTTAVLAGYAWRKQEQGTGAFVALMLSFTLYSAAHLGGLLTLHPYWRLVWENVQWVGTAIVPVFWLLFAMEYTGYDELATWPTVVALSVVPLVTVLLAWTNPWHGLMWTHSVLAPVDGLAIVEQSFGPWFWMYLIYTYGLVGVGSVLLVWLIRVSDHLYVDQSVLLLVGVTVPGIAGILTVFGLTPIRNPSLDMTPYAFAVTGLAFGYALFRRRLFELVPATRQLGRNAAIRHLDDGVGIVDTDRQVVYLNPAAADMLGCDPGDALGRPVRSLVDESALDFDAEAALAQLEREERVYEVRTSPIRDRRDSLIGHTLIVQDITARKRRERQLSNQRDELETLNELNTVIRGVNRALVSATTREEVERAVCERLADSDLYGTVCAADVPTWNDEADRWTVAGADVAEPALPAALHGDGFDVDPESGNGSTPATVRADRGTWTVVPLMYGRMVYGALGLRTQRADVPEEEREVLAELGELVGHAINGIEHRRLVTAESVVELEFATTDGDTALVAAAQQVECRLELSGLVPGAGEDSLAYVRVEGASPDSVRDCLAATTATATRTIRDDEDGGLVEWTVPGDTLLGTLSNHGANVLQARAEERTARFVVEAASDADVRTLRDRVRQAFPETRLDAKRERDRPVDRTDDIPADAVEDLTDRQREVMEAACRAGYFDWPRESTAEEVASSLDISPPTLHAHLRKAEKTLLADLFESTWSESD